MSLSNFILWSIFSIHAVNCINYDISVNTNKPIRTVPETLVSTSIDSLVATRTDWFGLNFTYIEPLAKALGPLYFRFGGTYADLLIFEENPSTHVEVNTPMVYFSSVQLEQLANFTRNVGWRLIYDLNDMLRLSTDINGKWNSSNAQLLINYLSSRGYDMIDFELGNEPENYRWNFDYNLTGAQIADSFKDLRTILDNNPLYKNSIIIGPSMSFGGIQILQDFLKHNGSSYINALAFHFYYENGAGATIYDFLNTTLMDTYKGSVEELVYIKNTYPDCKNLAVWAGETASGYGGGSINISDAYASGFLYLDKLGLSATYGLNGVIRQQIFDGAGSHYGLLDPTMRPNPDYWVAFLHKKLVGTTVYNVTVTPENRDIRLYGASSNGGVVVYGVYVSNESLIIDFPQISTKTVTAYILQPNDTMDLKSRANVLNGVLLEWQTHQPLPLFKKSVATLPLELPAYSQFFIVYEENSNMQCPDGWYKETTQMNKCIKFANRTFPLFGANFDCGTYGLNSTLLSIDNAFENAELLQQTMNSNINNGCAQFYIGLVKTQNNFAWTNGDPNTYVNWKSGYPTNDATQNCVVFDAKTGTWTNEDCDQGQCYICQLVL